MSKVSVVIPVFNGEQFIGEAIESVLGQDYRDTEIIVVDDGSVDRTRDAVKKFGTRVNYAYQDNIGADGAYNKGIALASGDLVAFLDHDDRWYPKKLSTQVAILDQRPEVGLTYSEVDVIDEYGGSLKKKHWATRRGIRNDLIGDYKAILRRKFPVSVPSAMLFRKEVLERVGGFDSQLPRNGGHADVQLCILAGEIAKLYFSLSSLVQYRVHKNQGSFSRREEIHTARIEMLDRLWNRWKDDPEKRALLLPHYGRYWSKRGRQALRKKDMQSAGRFLAVSLRYRPFAFRTWLSLLNLGIATLWARQGRS